MYKAILLILLATTVVALTFALQAKAEPGEMPGIVMIGSPVLVSTQ